MSKATASRGRHALVIFVLTVGGAHASGADVRHSVLIMQNARGTQTTSVGPDGTRHYTYEFNDRGRGPKIETDIRLGADGTPVSVASKGVDYLKAPVAETFSVEGGRATWKNKAESGQATIAGHAFYVSLDAVPAETALLAQALLKAPEGRLPLLPAGEARIERGATRHVNAAGASRDVTLYAITGLDFDPVEIWLDADGSFFAAVGGWSAIVSEGWESCVPELRAEQDAASTRRSAALAHATLRRPDRPLAIRNARLFDSETGRSHPGTTVIVAHDRIAAVGPDGVVPVPAGAEVVDAAGKAVLPGLWDMHVHLFDGAGAFHIAAGVTSVRDLANDPDIVTRLRTAWDAGTAIGPRVIAAGFIDGPGPYTGPTKAIAATLEEGKAWVDRYLALGYPQVKFYSSLSPDLVAPLAAYAHQHGMRVSGHVPAFMTAEQAVAAGYDEIQHANMLFLNFWGDTVKDTRGPLRFTAVAEKAATLDLGSEPVRAFVGLLKARGIVVDPTLEPFERMFTHRPGSIPPSLASVADRLPPQVRRGYLGGGLPVPDGMDQRYRDSFQALVRMTRLLYDSGVPIVAGTDGISGFGLQRELELYVSAGIPAPEVLKIATIGAARVMRRDGELGSIAVGKKADLVLFDGDPAATIADIRKPVLVMKDGLVYTPAALLRELGIAP